jgi:hypothetical protein
MERFPDVFRNRSFFENNSQTINGLMGLVLASKRRLSIFG